MDLHIWQGRRAEPVAPSVGGGSPIRGPRPQPACGPQTGAGMEFGGSAFVFAALLEPERDRQGRCVGYMPQPRYAKRDQVDLHAHGHGPFCALVTPELAQESGVFVITVDGQPRYIGMCDNLAERFGPRGYGHIQPRNCYDGGQSTNCKINHLVLKAAQRGSCIALWFCRSSDPRPIEERLIRELAPEWNAQG